MKRIWADYPINPSLSVRVASEVSDNLVAAGEKNVRTDDIFAEGQNVRMRGRVV